MGRRKSRPQSRPGVAPAVQASGPSYSPADPRLAELFAPPTGGPVAITPHTVLGISGVWAATRVIAGTVSTLPFKVYSKDADGNREDGPREAQRLARKPCPEMPGSVFWETITQHALLRGNGYAEIVRTVGGDVAELWLLTPDVCKPRRDERTKALYYEVRDPDGGTSRVDPAGIFHLRGLGFDGLEGYSVVTMARRSLSATASGDQAAESLYGNGLRPSGWIESDSKVPPPTTTQKANATESIQKNHGGVSNWGKVLLMYGGWKFHQLSLSPDDAQFLQGRQFQVEEVARWFNLPPHKLRHLLRATFSNIEHQGTEFVVETLAYWLGRIAEEWQDKVLGADSPLYPEHLLDALLRGDTIARYTAYGLGRQWGFLSPNDCRRKENMPARPGGDVLHVPVNMVPLGQEGQKAAAASGTPAEPGPGNGAAAAALATDLARQLDLADADLLDQLAGEDPDVLRQWCERAGPEEWLERFPMHDSRLTAIQPHLTGTDYRRVVVDGYAHQRHKLVQVAVAKGESLRDGVRSVAAHLRAGWWQHELADLFTGKAVPA